MSLRALFLNRQEHVPRLGSIFVNYGDFARYILELTWREQIVIRPFVIADYEQAIAFWLGIEGIMLNESDSKVAIEQFLTRNPNLSAIARQPDGSIIGAVLCGHNGRAGSLMHLAVAPNFRGQGLGRQLVEFCLNGLALQNIPRCNIFVYSDNDFGNQFWLSGNWADPKHWKVLQKKLLLASN